MILPDLAARLQNWALSRSLKLDWRRLAETEMAEWEVSLLFEELMLRVSSKRRGKVLRGQRDTSTSTQRGTRGAEAGSPQETEEGRSLQEAEEGWLRAAERALL